MDFSQAGGGAARGPADEPPPSWSLDQALLGDPAAVEHTILDENGEAQMALALWKTHSRELTESWRLAALQCVLAAQEVLASHMPDPSAGETRRHVDSQLRAMKSEFQRPATSNITEDKIRQLMEMTGKPADRCERQLRQTSGDVNLAAGRLLHLEDGDAGTHQRPELKTSTSQPDTAAAGSPHSGDTHEQLETPEPSSHQRLEAAEPAPQPDTAAATSPLSEADCCGANHAFYLNLRKIRSSHTHYGNGLVPELSCLKLITRSGWGYVTEELDFEGTIDEFHTAFGGRDDFSYSQLEGRHDYIQWLFPSPEPSRFNAASLPLSADEAVSIRSDAKARERIQTSFLLIADFYGFQMIDRKTGVLQPNPATCEARFANLNTPGNHNFMRISRILNCLNQTGWEIYSQPFLAALYKEAFETRALNCCCNSFARFWMKLLPAPDWQAAAERMFPRAVELLRPRPHPQLSTLGGGSGVGVAFGGSMNRLAPAAPAAFKKVGVAFWNFGDCTVNVYHGQKHVTSLGPNKKHGLYSFEGDEFSVMLPPTDDATAKPVATWTATDHDSQQVITEGFAVEGLTVGAIVCHNTHPHYEKHRMREIEHITNDLLDESKSVTTQAICERGDLQVYTATGQKQLPASGAGAVAALDSTQDGRKAQSPPFTTGERVKVHSKSSGGWHDGTVTNVVSSSSAVPAEQAFCVSVEYRVDEELRTKRVVWEPHCQTIMRLAEPGA